MDSYGYGRDYHCICSDIEIERLLFRRDRRQSFPSCSARYLPSCPLSCSPVTTDIRTPPSHPPRQVRRYRRRHVILSIRRSCTDDTAQLECARGSQGTRRRA
jgi:hypothetical protein